MTAKVVREEDATAKGQATATAKATDTQAEEDEKAMRQLDSFIIRTAKTDGQDEIKQLKEKNRQKAEEIRELKNRIKRYREFIQQNMHGESFTKGVNDYTKH